MQRQGVDDLQHLIGENCIAILGFNSLPLQSDDQASLGRRCCGVL